MNFINELNNLNFVVNEQRRANRAIHGGVECSSTQMTLTEAAKTLFTIVSDVYSITEVAGTDVLHGKSSKDALHPFKDELKRLDKDLKAVFITLDDILKDIPPEAIARNNTFKKTWLNSLMDFTISEDRITTMPEDHTKYLEKTGDHNAFVSFLLKEEPLKRCILHMFNRFDQLIDNYNSQHTTERT